MILFINFIINLAKTVTSKEGIKVILAFQPWAMKLFDTNFAVNFLLYRMKGKDFLSSLRTTFSRIAYKVFLWKQIWSTKWQYVGAFDKVSFKQNEIIEKKNTFRKSNNHVYEMGTAWKNWKGFRMSKTFIKVYSYERW